MNNIRFKQQVNRRKTWIFPLIIIILLYLTIPIMLINKADSSFDKAKVSVKTDVLKAANYYAAAIVFIDLAKNFPGFSAWAKKTADKGKKELTFAYKEKCKEMLDKSEEERNIFCNNSKTFNEKTFIKLSECDEICK